MKGHKSYHVAGQVFLTIGAARAYAYLYAHKYVSLYVNGQHVETFVA